MVKPNFHKEENILFKGIQDLSLLEKAIKISIANSLDKKAFIQTDMRCHMNPTRGLNIRKLGILMFRRLTRFCPKCNAVGFGNRDFRTGRQCRVCDTPTDVLLCYLRSCSKCLYQEERAILCSPQKVNPMYCNVCNP